MPIRRLVQPAGWMTSLSFSNEEPVAIPFVFLHEIGCCGSLNCFQKNDKKIKSSYIKEWSWVNCSSTTAKTTIYISYDWTI